MKKRTKNNFFHNYNINLYKNTTPSNTLVYTDNENDSEELKLLGKPINYDYLVNILQSDLSNIENFIDEKNGIIIDKKMKIIFIIISKNYLLFQSQKMIKKLKLFLIQNLKVVI